MKTTFKLTIATLLLCMMSITAFASTTPQTMHVSCTAPNPDHQSGLHRPKGDDGNIWIFEVELDGDAHFVKGPYWDYPGEGGSDPDWGSWVGGEDGDSSLSWSSPGKTGSFQVRVKGKISCGDGGGGEPIDFSAGWDGEVAYNAEIKVKRSGTPESAYSTSATVAAGGKSTSEHQADVMVIATDDDGNPMEGITVDAPTIQNGDGSVPAENASISMVDATTDEDGKAYFTFTSSDIAGNLGQGHNVTLKADKEKSSAAATITQVWTQLDNTKGELPSDSWKYASYFDYDVASPIIFRMALNSDGSVPITAHNISFGTTEVTGWVWDPQAGEDWDGDGLVDGKYIYLENQNYEDISDEYGNLVEYNGLSKSGGSYSVNQTIHKNNYFWVDIVYFTSTDNNVDDGK